jgi:hypothetical protein
MERWFHNLRVLFDFFDLRAVRFLKAKALGVTLEVLASFASFAELGAFTELEALEETALNSGRSDLDPHADLVTLCILYSFNAAFLKRL